MSAFSTFEFDLPKPLLDQLVDHINRMKPERLTLENVREHVPNVQGIYQICLDGELVYVGKTDNEAGLRKRLERHAAKIRNRPSLESRLVTFVAVQIYVFTAVDLETMLIQYYKGKNVSPAWNGSGFGAIDPGRERDTTKDTASGFDAMYPITIDEPSVELAPGEYNIADVLDRIKSQVN